MNQPLKVIHIRRCHVCGEVNESEHGTVHKCENCGKHLAPFYYFDESKCIPLGDALDSEKSEAKQDSYYNPIWGLSAFW
ncbi:MAG: hypothetical protein AB7O96_18330 [Pseudobdellovibrionaceae bacterium]